MLPALLVAPRREHEPLPGGSDRWGSSHWRQPVAHVSLSAPPAVWHCLSVVLWSGLSVAVVVARHRPPRCLRKQHRQDAAKRHAVPRELAGQQTWKDADQGESRARCALLALPLLLSHALLVSPCVRRTSSRADRPAKGLPVLKPSRDRWCRRMARTTMQERSHSYVVCLFACCLLAARCTMRGDRSFASPGFAGCSWSAAAPTSDD